MSTLYVTEYGSTGRMTVATAPAVLTQAVTYSTTAASAAFNERTRVVRVISPTACHIKFGTGTPEATTSDEYLPADQEAWREVEPGYKVAAVDAA